MKKRHPMTTCVLATAVLIGTAVVAQNAVEEEPRAAIDPGPSPTLGAKPPTLDDLTVVLFDGTDWSGWKDPAGEPSPWEVQDDGTVLVTKQYAISDAEFGDAQIHLEFFCPEMPGASGQARSNSGVYIHARYEVQILDSFGLTPTDNDCGAVYSIAPPLVNACRPPGEWQSYDIIFTAPRRRPGGEDGGEVIEPPHVTVLLNGILVHNHVAIPRPTRASLAHDFQPRGPLVLQDHGNPVRFRNIWIRHLDAENKNAPAIGVHGGPW